MIIFVLNCGSSSIKYKIIDMPSGIVLISGSISRIGYDDAKFIFCADQTLEKTQPIANHEQGINLLLKTIEGQRTITGIGLDDIESAGHRVVQGGSEMNVSRIVDDRILNYIENIADLAPLHNPNHLKGIRAVQKLLPNLPQVVVFDNGFHTSIPEHVYTYGLNYDIAKRLKIRKYGFHGIAFRSMISKAEALLGEDLSDKKIVNMMLGSGTTANATLNGASYEVSTGFTPQEGLIQSTRAGDIDAAAVLYMMNQENLTTAQADEIINKQSGWSGMCGIGQDMYDIIVAARGGSSQAQLTIDAVTHRIKKYIGAYAAAMGGIDLLIFSGGMGENSAEIRAKVCEGLVFLGIEIDEQANANGKGERIISCGKVNILVVNANEEEMIAQDTYELLN